MKRRIIYALIALGSLSSCSDFLELQPKDKLSADALFSDPAGVKLYMANLYYQLPIEDFTAVPTELNYNVGSPNNNGLMGTHLTDETLHSQVNPNFADNYYAWWTQGYKFIRDINLLIDAIPTLSILEVDKNKLLGEASFLRAYAYFALAKRYGGVSLIFTSQKYSGNVDDLKVPRSTEEETWDKVLAECDVAAQYLPDSWDAENERRATKWTALALKSRAALFAASVAKFGGNANVDGPAVSQKLVGMAPSVAAKYYQACIDASETLISSGKYRLYKAQPGSPEEAAVNYQALFQNPENAKEEAIFVKGFSMPGSGKGHNYDIWFQPNQTANGWPHPGRMNPSMDLVDAYEYYDAPGEDGTLRTTGSGNENPEGYLAGKDYLHFDTPSAAFQGKDARLFGTLILPGTTWKNTPIVIQAGFVRPDGSAVINTIDQITVEGKTHYTYGGSSINTYSGFNTQGGNYTRSGFLLKKFLNEGAPVTPSWNQSTADYIDFRLAEIYLNYAEAHVESNLGDAAKAATYMNATRIRAGHKVSIPVTVTNVLRERRVELAFENQRMWDLIRRREYHTVFNNKRRPSLMPVLDLRQSPAKYILVRGYFPTALAMTFAQKSYYRSIPGISANDLVQNPGY